MRQFPATMSYPASIADLNTNLPILSKPFIPILAGEIDEISGFVDLE